MIPLHLEAILVSLLVVQRASSADDKWVWGGDKGQSRIVSGERDHQQVSRESLEYDRKLEGVSSNERPTHLVYQDNVSKQTADVLSQYEKNRPLSDYRYEVYENNGIVDVKPPKWRPMSFAQPPSRPVVPAPVPFASFNRPLIAPNRPLIAPNRPLNAPNRPFPSPNRPAAPFASPNRPTNQFIAPNRPPLVPLASPNRPIPAVSKPSALPITLPSRPNPNFAASQGAAASVGILTGPVPSWENAQSTHKNGDPTQFERCKCSFSFNCKAPGIQFGNCDVGKQYCCYNSKGGATTNAGFGSTLNVDRGDPNGNNGPVILTGPNRPVDNVPVILAGPDGPVDNYDFTVLGPDSSGEFPEAGAHFNNGPVPFRPPPPNGGPPEPPLPPSPPPAPEPLIFRPFGEPPPPPPVLSYYDILARTANATNFSSENASNSEDP